jgi:hypothetical protein
VRFLGFPFEWDMAYNNLPCTNVQAVINIVYFGANCGPKYSAAKRNRNRRTIVWSTVVPFL